VVFTGPPESADYFAEIDGFLRLLFGDAVDGKYQIIVGDAEAVGRYVSAEIKNVRRARRRTDDAYYFNWLLSIPHDHQMPFDVTHASVAALRLKRSLPVAELAVEIRRAFSAIVTGNVKDQGIRLIKQHGPFQIHADKELTDALDALLKSFADQGRMKMSGEYTPCYEVVADS
jgi:hypothetical protein